MSQLLRVLIVEDSEDDVQLVIRELRKGNFDPTCQRVETPEQMRQALEKFAWNIVISDFSMPHFSGLAALHLLKQTELDLPFILISGTIGEDVAVAAMKAGAHDYIMKGNLARLVPAVERELREAEGRREHKRVEEQLRQSQKMDAVGRLAGGVAHDFNNLLTIISGRCEILKMRLNKDSPLWDDIDLVMKTSGRAVALTRQLLHFSRRKPLEAKPININTIIADMEKMLQRLIGADIELCTIMQNQLKNVMTDPSQIEQVILNLVVNARDAMPQGGKITIETSEVSLNNHPVRNHKKVDPGHYVMLKVSDTGIGMDAATRSHLFEPFFTTKEEGKGTGLGLSTVYGIIKQSKGFILPSSEPGKGTTFDIYLPVVDNTSESDVDNLQPTESAHGTETVLIAEDEDGVRDLARTILQNSGYKILEAKDGVQALALAAQYQGPIHLLLTDVVMPKMNGAELKNKLSSSHPETRVLFMSGYTWDVIGKLGALDVNTGLLLKPFTFESLGQKVREALEGHLSR